MPPGAEPTRWSPFGFTLPGGDPSLLIAEGDAAVQDEGSQLAALALSLVPIDASPGPERWLDLCAGPGGKARLLRGLAASGPPERRALLIASDLHPHRAALVKAAFARAGQGGDAPPGRVPPASAPAGRAPGARAAVLAADGRHPPWRDGVFDRVLADVPCSGLGALRRRPEARWRKSESDLPALAELQRTLLRSALAACRPGGVVGYVTCSPVSAETRDVVTAVTSAMPGVEILDAPALLPAIPNLASPAPLFAQLWPHRHATDAIFIALLRRL